LFPWFKKLAEFIQTAKTEKMRFPPAKEICKRLQELSEKSDILVLSPALLSRNLTTFAIRCVAIFRRNFIKKIKYRSI